MSKVRFEKRGKKTPVKGYSEDYPSKYARGTRPPRTPGAPIPPSINREPREILCAQCGFRIEDYAEIDACPFCDATNFLGRKL